MRNPWPKRLRSAPWECPQECRGVAVAAIAAVAGIIE